MNIKVENYTKIIKGATVLETINLEFNAGTIYGLIGKNGSGKTMLLRAISGLIRPTEGKIIVGDQELHKDISFPKDMGIIIENPEFIENITGLENLRLLARIKNKISEDEIRKWMEKFLLDPKSKKTLKEYSLGMKQKIGIIQALMENPNLLLLDEPFNALDMTSAELLRKLFKKYKSEGKIIIITSHHSEDIDTLCDIVITMADGKIKSK